MGASVNIEILTRKSKKKAAITWLASWLVKDMGLDRYNAECSIILTKESDQLGACHQILPGVYSIVLNSNKPLAQTMQTLCHEFVHLKQFLTGKLRYSEENPGKMVWCGMDFCPKKTDYYSQPWEIQAFERENLLFRRATAALIKSQKD